MSASMAHAKECGRVLRGRWCIRPLMRWCCRHYVMKQHCHTAFDVCGWVRMGRGALKWLLYFFYYFGIIIVLLQYVTRDVMGKPFIPHCPKRWESPQLTTKPRLLGATVLLTVGRHVRNRWPRPNTAFVVA